MGGIVDQLICSLEDPFSLKKKTLVNKLHIVNRKHNRKSGKIQYKLSGATATGE